MDVDNLENCRFDDEGDFVCDGVEVSAAMVEDSVPVSSKNLEQDLSKSVENKPGRVL